MATTVFVAGSMHIKLLDAKVKERVEKIVNSHFAIVVGDAEGADRSIQALLFELGATNTTVYCSGAVPRNNVGNWPIHSVTTHHTEGSRAFFTAKDIVMADVADYGLMIWDAKSTGTLSNVIELLKRKKKSVVFVNKDKSFINVTSVPQLEELVTRMSRHAKEKAEEKIHLTKQIDLLKHEQVVMFAKTRGAAKP
jgi:hypothetical protein